MINLNKYEVWFITGSQHLYGAEALQQVNEDAREISIHLDQSNLIPVRVVFKPVLTTPEAIYSLCQVANSQENCIGLIAWMHTFSPAKMWIGGLKILHKPLLHLHTQFNRDIPWNRIDMDFMNLHQSAHGGREFGFINTRLHRRRKVVTGYWKDKYVLERINIWSRAAAAWTDAQQLKIARLGDNMRQVAVTEGDKVAAQMQFGYSVNGYGMGDLVAHVNGQAEAEVNHLLAEYDDSYQMQKELQAGGTKRKSLREAAKIELGLKSFLEEGGFGAFTDTFENLHGLEQLPGIGVQRLMAAGYGFGAEGDWKTAALVRAMKVMGQGMEGGNSFMEDYTYHFQPGNNQVLGAHMLEICASLAEGRPSCEIHPLGIGGKADPVRLVFSASAGKSLNASVVDLGSHFRLLVNEVKAIEPDQNLPKLPVARVLWKPYPDLNTAATAWILAGGAHHTCFSQNLSYEYLEDFAEMANIELVTIDEQTELRRFRQELRWNELYYGRGR